MFVSTPLVLSYYGSWYLRGDPDNILLIFTLAVPELAVPAGVHFLLHAVVEVVPDYFVRSLRSDHVAATYLFGFPLLYRISSAISGSTRMPSR